MKNLRKKLNWLIDNYLPCAFFLAVILTLFVMTIIGRLSRIYVNSLTMPKILSIDQKEIPGVLHGKDFPTVTNIYITIETNCTCERDQNIDWDVIHNMEMIAQLVQAEAGNQDLTGMRYVVDVVLNRVDDPRFPDTIEEVIYQKNQFSVVSNGMFKRAAGNISDDAYLAVEMEWNERLDDGIVYFNAGSKLLNGVNPFKYGDHWFGY